MCYPSHRRTERFPWQEHEGTDVSDTCLRQTGSEDQLAFIPGDEPGTALRIRQHPTRDGLVLLEWLAHDPVLGWYRQKSLSLPRAMLGETAKALRIADCLMPRETGVPGLRLHPAPGVHLDAAG